MSALVMGLDRRVGLILLGLYDGPTLPLAVLGPYVLPAFFL